MPTYLDEILASHRAVAAADDRSRTVLLAAAHATGPVRSFRDALAAGPGIGVIAEIKRRSPSRGALAPDLDPAAVAKSYEAGGAVALSVLTDAQYFGGSPADLTAARAAVELPVLRKDFTVSDADVYDARIFEADAVLLIVAALDDDELPRLLGLAGELGMDALVEVHDKAELDRALAVDAQLIGVNQRDLRTFAVDTDRAVQLAANIPSGVITVAESGVMTAGDVRRLADAGYDAVLVGEALVTAADPGQMVQELIGCS